MTETQDLIAAALRLAALAERNTDCRDEWQEAIDSVREACARAMVQPVGEVPMPEPAYLNAGFEGWCSPLRSAYSEGDMRTYGEQCRAAGYAAGVVAAEARADETRRLYNELLHQVGMKYPGETRHETAIRYLRVAEIHVCGPAVAALRGEVKP